MKRFAVLMALAACAPRPDPAPTAPEADSCGASAYQDLAGQDAQVLERILILRQVRMIRPNTPVTADYWPDRLNFEVGADGRIFRVFCG